MVEDKGETMKRLLAVLMLFACVGCDDYSYQTNTDLWQPQRAVAPDLACRNMAVKEISTTGDLTTIEWSVVVTVSNTTVPRKVEVNFTSLAANGALVFRDSAEATLTCNIPTTFSQKLTLPTKAVAAIMRNEVDAGTAD
jgi:hypothetical protein